MAQMGDLLDQMAMAQMVESFQVASMDLMEGP